MSVRATCPVCGKVLVVQAIDAAWFPRHRVPPPSRGMCTQSGGAVRAAHRIHPCVDCAALPTESDVDPDLLAASAAIELRPAVARPVVTEPGARNPRCATHARGHKTVLKARKRAGNRQRDRGISQDEFDELWTAQGQRCGGCGRALSSTSRAPSTDHDHRRARQHGHPESQACRRCVRGALCDPCNRVIVGRYSVAQLQGVIAYMTNPTAQRLGWWDEINADNGSGS